MLFLDSHQMQSLGSIQMVYIWSAWTVAHEASCHLSVLMFVPHHVYVNAVDLHCTFIRVTADSYLAFWIPFSGTQIWQLRQFPVQTKSFYPLLAVFPVACERGFPPCLSMWELLRLMLVWELFHGLRRHNWRQAGLPPNRNLGAHDLSQQLFPTVLPWSAAVHGMGMFSMQKPCLCASHGSKQRPPPPHTHAHTHKLHHGQNAVCFPPLTQGTTRSAPESIGGLIFQRKLFKWTGWMN